MTCADLELHPLNEGFVWHTRRTDLRRISAAQARAFDEKGYFVFEDAFDAEEIRLLCAYIDPLEAAAETKLRAAPQQRQWISRAGEITFNAHLVKQEPFLRQFCHHPILVDLCHDLIGNDVRLYWDQSVYKKPGMTQEFPWHQDNGYTYVAPQQYLTCWIALTDATIDNGCPWVVPGIHHQGTLEHQFTELGYRCMESSDDAQALPLRAGSIAVFSSLTPHRTGPNLSQAVRKAYIVQFAPDGAHIFRKGEAPISCNDPARQFPVLLAGLPSGYGE